MCWSQPKPWAKTIGCQPGTPDTRTLFRTRACMRPTVPRKRRDRSCPSAQREPDHRLQLGDGDIGVDDLDRGHAHGPGRLEVDAEVVEEDRLVRLDPELLARSEERRVGEECVSTGRSRWSPDH